MQQRKYLSNLGKDCTYNYQWMFDREVFRTAMSKNLPVFMYTSPTINLERMNKEFTIPETPDNLIEVEPINECVDGVRLKECFLDSLGNTDPIDAEGAKLTAFDVCLDKINKELGWVFERIRKAANDGLFSLTIPKADLEGKVFGDMHYHALKKLGYKLFEWSYSCEITWEIKK